MVEYSSAARGTTVEEGEVRKSMSRVRFEFADSEVKEHTMANGDAARGTKSHAGDCLKGKHRKNTVTVVLLFKIFKLY